MLRALAARSNFAPDTMHMQLHRHTAAAAMLLAALAAPATGGAADTTDSKRPQIPILKAADIAARCDGALVQARQQLQALEKTKDGNVLAAFDALGMPFGDFANPVYLLQNVSPDKTTRDAAQACLEKLLPFETEIYQSVPLYERVRDLQPKDAIDAALRRDLLNSFEDAGATLPPDRRARAKAIFEEIERSDLQFSKNVNEDPTRVTITVAEAAGLPDAWIAARKRDPQGNLVLGLDYPTVVPFLELATNADARRRVWLAKQNEGGEQNLKLMERVIQLRYELAQLHGLPDFATLQLKRRMAQTPDAVYQFLDSVQKAAGALQEREFADLRAEKSKIEGTPLPDTKLARWDVAFLKERVRKQRYSVDQEALRAYFPTEASLRYTMHVAGLLYGIEFVQRDVPVWHADVRYYDVYDRAADGRRGAFVGGIYLDLFPRDGKYNHAAAFGVRRGSTLAARSPISVLVTNFNRQGLNHDELETLLHEFGHVLHGVLSTTRYAEQSGTSVKRDFVEAPSQMFEEWARREEALSLLRTICPTCPQLTSQQIRQIDDARRFGRGNFFSRQREYALFDMQLHTGRPRAPLPVWVAIEKDGPLGHVDGSIFPAGFGHVMSGYPAGYYGYMWSQVLALDMLSAFDGKLLNPTVGRRYRDTVLARGGEVPPQELVEAFLGRKPNSDAFYAEIAGKR